MTSNDSTPTLRYEVWKPNRHTPSYPESNIKEYATWKEAERSLMEPHETGSLYEKGYMIWDYSTDPPTNVTYHNPEGTHMTTPPPGKQPAPTRIPSSIKSVEIERSPYPNNPKPLYVTLKGDTWLMRFDTTDDELLTRINEIAAAMEEVK